MNKIFFSFFYISSFFAPVYFAISVGSFFLYPFRALLFLGWLLGIFINLIKGSFDARPFKSNLFIIFFLVFWLLYAMLSFLWIKDYGLWIRSIAHLFSGVSVVLFCLYLIKKPSDLRFFVHIWLLMLFVSVIIGVWEIFTANHLISSVFSFKEISGQRTPTAFFFNPNDYALFLSLSICFALVFFKSYKSFLLRLAVLSLIGFSFMVLFFTGSRANLISSTIAFTFFLKFLLEKTKNKFIWEILFFLPMASLIIYYLFQSEGVQSLFEQIQDNTGSGGIRINLIKNAFVFLLQSYGFGVGSGNVEWYMQNTSIWDTKDIINTHNWWVEVLTNYGFFVFFSYLSFFYYAIKKSYKYIKTGSDKTLLLSSEIILLSTIAFSIGSMSSSSLIAFLPHWFFLGFIMCFFAIMKQNKQTIDNTTNGALGNKMP